MVDEIDYVSGPAGPVNDEGDGVVSIKLESGTVLNLYVRPVGDDQYDVIPPVGPEDDLSDEVCPVCGERVYASWIAEPGDERISSRDEPTHEHQTVEGDTVVVSTLTEHVPRVWGRTRIAATSYRCERCGEIQTTPSGFTDECSPDSGVISLA